MTKKKFERSQPPDFVTVTALKTVQWNYNDSREFVEGNSYSIPMHLYTTLAKYFVIKENSNSEEIKDGE